MAQFVVLVIKNNDVPAPGEAGIARVYRGDHAGEAEAVDAAADVFTVRTGERLWAAPAGGLTRYVATETTTRSVEVQ